MDNKICFISVSSSHGGNLKGSELAPESITNANLLVPPRGSCFFTLDCEKLKKETKGSIILDISKKSPLIGLVRKGDIILEVQKNKVLESKELNKLVESILKKGEQTLLLTIINNNNQRRYLGVKTN